MRRPVLGCTWSARWTTNSGGYGGQRGLALVRVLHYVLFLSLTRCTRSTRMRLRMKLPSRNEVEVLRLLAGGRELYGLELVKRSGGTLKRNWIYVVLGRMEDQSYIRGREIK